MEVSPFIPFLKYCLDESATSSESFYCLDWDRLMIWASEQAIIGVVFGGLEKLNHITTIPTATKLKWIGFTQRIEKQNRLINLTCLKLVSELEQDGLKCCLLKGQGNTTQYSNPLRRTPGDIDLWINGKTICEIIKLARDHNPKAKACYHHVDFGLYRDVEVELHYRPSFMNNLIANRRLQKWIRNHEVEQFSNFINLMDTQCKLAIPTWEFNVVFQLSHIYRHVIQRGVGMRQIIDYYYLLKTDKRCQTEDVIETLKYLGLRKIAGAVMWVLKEILGLEEQYLIAPVNERGGRFLYKEIMKGGNFGQYHAKNGKPQGNVSKNIDRLKQDLRLVTYFPSECLWEPVFRVYHWAWRLRYNR